MIRQTFGAKEVLSDVSQRVVFLIGLPPDDETANQIKEESVTHNDMVQGPFIDSYHNLTLKAVMGLCWVAKSCPSAEVIIKIDDDVIVNVFRLSKHVLPAIRHQERNIGCDYFTKNQGLINRSLKWKVEDHEFPGLKAYPFKYCKGFFVGYTTDLVQEFISAAKVTPFFWIDDVYVFGMLPETVGDVEFSYWGPRLSMKHDAGRSCLARKGIQCEYIAVTPSRWFDFPEGKKERCEFLGYVPDECVFYLRRHWIEEEGYHLWGLMTDNLSEEERHTWGVGRLVKPSFQNDADAEFAQEEPYWRFIKAKEKSGDVARGLGGMGPRRIFRKRRIVRHS